MELCVARHLLNFGVCRVLPQLVHSFIPLLLRLMLIVLGRQVLQLKDVTVLHPRVVKLSCQCPPNAMS